MKLHKLNQWFTFLGKNNGDKTASGIIIGIKISGDPNYDARKIFAAFAKS